MYTYLFCACFISNLNSYTGNRRLDKISSSVASDPVVRICPRLLTKVQLNFKERV